MVQADEARIKENAEKEAGTAKHGTAKHGRARVTAAPAVPPAANGKARKSAYDCHHCGSSKVSDHIGGGSRICYDCNGYL